MARKKNPVPEGRQTLRRHGIDVPTRRDVPKKYRVMGDRVVERWVHVEGVETTYRQSLCQIVRLVTSETHPLVADECQCRE